MMAIRLAAYVSGAPYLVRVCHRPGGRRFAVIDRTKRWRSAARAMRAGGRSEYEIVAALGCSRQALRRVTAFNWRF